jgi:6-pyruvoyl-tetrahydropterin synthase
VDFGGLGDLKRSLEHQFDHTFLVAPDDPALSDFKQLAEQDVLDLRVMDPTMEGMAVWVAAEAARWTAVHAPQAEVIEVACWENEKNCARWVQ